MLKNLRLYNIFVVLFLATGLFMTGCNSSTNVESPSPSDVTLQFATNSSSMAKTNQLQKTSDTLGIEGSNGTLLLRDLRFIVEDFKLERADGECEDIEGEEEEGCEEFESRPFFIDLPLDGDTLNLDTSSIEPGLYEELEFKVDNLDLEDEEGDEQDAKEQLADQVRAEFPNWPDEVSMVIIGDFISNEGDTTSFKTFAKAELEIEMEFSPPLEVSDNSVSKLLRVNITPTNWFLRTDGTVINLSEYDFDSSGQILEFEVEIEDGFEEVEVDEEEDDDDDEDEDEDEDEDDNEDDDDE